MKKLIVVLLLIKMNYGYIKIAHQHIQTIHVKCDSIQQMYDYAKNEGLFIVDYEIIKHFVDISLDK